MHKSNFVIFLAELAGTFGLLVATTGSIVYDGSIGGVLGIGFIVAMHFVGISLMIILFGKYSMAHFNPAVTVGLFAAKYIPAKQLPLYVSAQAIGALLGSLFVKYVLGDYANLGLNSPNYLYAPSLFFVVEILATMFLMGSILIAINVRHLQLVFISIIISGTVALDVYFLGPISGASMNPIRSLMPSLFTNMTGDLWLYWTAPFIGSIIVAMVFNRMSRKKIL
ncbi:MIP/aquaporin family protein [Candidatus Nitrosotenuis cloacae]|uniref:MIP/aquaporin family protein n=1 Tax=Candidatus Nitrosotenuis cloacae TaxID=1603555 RepID=UPI0022826DA4|nr:aquaporin [Candidatus Nitrosotenuis cloacae]